MASTMHGTVAVPRRARHGQRRHGQAGHRNQRNFSHHVCFHVFPFLLLCLNPIHRLPQRTLSISGCLNRLIKRRPSPLNIQPLGAYKVAPRKLGFRQNSQPQAPPYLISASFALILSKFGNCFASSLPSAYWITPFLSTMNAERFGTPPIPRLICGRKES